MDDPVKSPELSAGRCTTAAGLKLLDGAGRKSDSDASLAERREAARWMCRGCPVLAQCLTRVTEEEQPAGAWGGFYAGMSRHQRVVLARNRRKKDAGN